MRDILNNSTKPLLILLFLFSSLEVVNAQPLTWEKLYPGYYVGYGLARINDTTFYVCCTKPNGVALLKINQYGDTLWTRNLSISKYDVANSILVTEDGGCVVSGNYLWGFTAKFAADGGLKWVNSQVGGKKIIKCGESYYICGGKWIFKINFDGYLIWARAYEEYQNVTLTDICADTVSNTIMGVGTTYVKIGPVESIVRNYIIKIDTSGNALFQKAYKISRNWTNGKYISKYKDDFFIAGETEDSTGTYTRSYIMRINSSGDSLFKKIFPSSKNDMLECFFIKGENKLTFSTQFYSNFIPDTARYNLFTSDTLGNILQFKRINQYGDYFLYSGIALSSGYNIFAGYWEHSQTKLWIIKTDSLFNFPTIGINNLSSEIPENFSLFQNYPNPFNPSTKISYSLKKSSNIELKLFDINGRMIKIIESGFKPAGSYEINFNSEALSSGVYFYSLYSEGIIVDTKKMALLK